MRVAAPRSRGPMRYPWRRERGTSLGSLSYRCSCGLVSAGDSETNVMRPRARGCMSATDIRGQSRCPAGTVAGRNERGGPAPMPSWLQQHYATDRQPPRWSASPFGWSLQPCQPATPLSTFTPADRALLSPTLESINRWLTESLRRTMVGAQALDLGRCVTGEPRCCSACLPGVSSHCRAPVAYAVGTC